MSEIQPIPAGFAAVLPYLVVKNAHAALEFYQNAFAAELMLKMLMPSGAVMHAELRIGQAIFMLSEQNDDWGSKSPDMLGATPVTLMLYVADVDAVVEKAVQYGATTVMPVADQFWGDRTGTIQDPFGHQWMIATHIENVSEQELMTRAAKMFG